MRRKAMAVAVVAVFSGWVSAQVARGPLFGGPLPGLTPQQAQAFETGRASFLEVETPEEGLGPIFNGRSCVECHGVPAPGGSSPVDVTRFGRMTNGVFDPLERLGGSLLQRLAIDPMAREQVPREANVVAQRNSTPLFGLGLIEAIPDAAILANAARIKPDGIAGRVAMVVDITTGQTRVGRFGWKAQHATLLAIAGDAYRNEMGITNRFFPTENAPNGNAALLGAFDRVADPEDVVDPETGRGDTDVLADFMRFLAPPVRLQADGSARAGDALFTTIGCAHCHVPSMSTGPNPIAALDRKAVALYSDLLLHDMGSLGDGIAQAAAGPREMKTPPLWGLRASAPYLHDGRAPTIDQAIRQHEGEAAAVRGRYEGLSPQQRQQVLDFLRTL